MGAPERPIPDRPQQPYLVSLPEAFDEWHDDHVRAVVPEEIAKAVQDLLILETQIRRTETSFGLDAQKTVEAIRPLLASLRSGCKQRWDEL